LSEIVIFGGKGQLGSDFIHQIPGKFSYLNTGIDKADIRELSEVDSIFKGERPKFVFNFASITNVDYCEENPDDAYKVNVVGTKNIAICCRKYNSTLIFISTGAVFSGKKKIPYIENDKRSPVNIYGKTKKDAEDIIKKLLTKYYIIRCGWLFGGYKNDKKFVGIILNKLAEEKKIYVVNDKFGSPTYSIDFSKALLKIIEYEKYGVFHIVNEGCCSRYECALEIKKLSKSNSEIIPISSEKFKLSARRPTMEALRNYNLEEAGYFKMRGWKDALREYIRNY
jgi:dTDP-4-dehydrorhamnose reductase